MKNELVSSEFESQATRSHFQMPSILRDETYGKPDFGYFCVSIIYWRVNHLLILFIHEEFIAVVQVVDGF